MITIFRVFNKKNSLPLPILYVLVVMITFIPTQVNCYRRYGNLLTCIGYPSPQKHVARHRSEWSKGAVEQELREALVAHVSARSPQLIFNNTSRDRVR